MDQTEALRNAVARLRPELPDLLGDASRTCSRLSWRNPWSNWTPVLPAHPSRSTKILALFGRHPRAHQRLVELMAKVQGLNDRATRGGGGGGGGVPAESPAVIRYTDIACPRRVWVETPRIALVIRLTVQHPAYSAAVEELELDPTQPVRVSLQAPGFDVLGKPVQEIPIPRDADSDPVVFYLRPMQVGHTSLTFDFFQGNQPVGTTSVAVEVTAYEAVTGAEPRPARPLRFGGDVEPPDMVLHIAVQESPPALVFSLIRDGGDCWRTFPPVGIVRAP